jgi:hypothetical protein
MLYFIFNEYLAGKQVALAIAMEILFLRNDKKD